MPTFSVAILPGPPDIQVSMAGGISYEEFANMLGPLSLRIRRFFVESQNNPQVIGNLGYTIFDATGPQNTDSIKPRKSPYQYQNSLEFSASGAGEVVLNGNSHISFNLLPAQLLTMTLETDEISPQTLTPGRLQDNFSVIPDTLGNFAEFKRRLTSNP